MSVQKIVLTIAAANIQFNVTREKYNDYINGMMPNNKVAVSHNFLVDVVDEKNSSALIQVIKDNPGSEIAITAAVVNQYVPDLAITVKKSSN